MPRFKHDCPCCHYLGPYQTNDLYYCSQGGRIPTIIARYGNEGSEYTSGLYETPPFGGYIVSCSNESFFGTPDYGSNLRGDCVEYTALVEDTKE